MLLNKNKETCIFINSCDKTHDVARYFIKSFHKFIKNDYLDVFIGVNKKVHDKEYSFLNYIYAPKSNWKIETTLQLDELKNKYGYQNVIHILDDFIFCDYSDLDDLIEIIKLFKQKKIKYLCLKKVKECFAVNILSSIRSKDKISKIRENYPYYTSLQISLWDIEYFKKNIECCKSIWNFERLQLLKNHYNVSKDLFHYNHVVEKGEWNYGTLRYIEKYVSHFNPGNRQFRKSFLGSQIFYLQKISFFIFGFLIMRIRKN